MAHPGITIDPEIMMGKPTIAGTRLTVELILEQLAAGRSYEELLDDYPRLTHDGIMAALAFAAGLVTKESARLAEHHEQAAS